MKNHFISIIIVAYNAEKFIDRALEAIAIQSFRDFDIVLVNNGSTDRTNEIFEKYQSRHPEMDIIINTIPINKGLSNGRNVGLLSAAGDYVLFNDADDWMDPDCLEALSGLAIASGADRIVQQVRFVNDCGKITDELTYSDHPSRWLKNSLQGDLFSRKAILKNGIMFDPDVFFDDVYFTCLFSALCPTAAFLRETHYNMLIHDNSTIHKPSSEPGYFVPLMDRSFKGMQTISEIVWKTEDWFLYEYSIMELYYGFVFRGKEMSINQRIHTYIQYNKIMRKYYPDYLKNQNVKLKAPNGFSGHFKRNIWACFQAEKIDKLLHIHILMSLILVIYHVALRCGLYNVPS